MDLKNLKESIQGEIKEYVKNAFAQNVDTNFDTSTEEPFIENFREMIEEIPKEGIDKVLNECFSHGEEDIKFENPEGVTLEIYKSIAGNIPVFYVKNENDFYQMVTKVVHKGKVDPNIKNTGASFVSGENLRFIILSNKPYSNIPASEINLDENTWKDYSMKIRREHECTHYFTRKFLGSARNNIHDELIADFAGIVSACGKYEPLWFLCGMGIDKFPEKQPVRRFPVYTKGLSDEALDALKQITIEASVNVQKWSLTPEAQSLPLVKKILFLTSKNLLELSELF